MARPSIFTPELAERICARLAAGETLRRICRDDSMPDRKTVRLWRLANAEFFSQYAQARIDQAEVYFDDVIDLSDDTAGDPAEVQSAKLRVDSRKWVLARMDRNLYGEKASLDLGGQPGNPLKTEAVSVHVDPNTLPDADRDAILRIAHRVLQGGS